MRISYNYMENFFIASVSLQFYFILPDHFLKPLRDDLFTVAKVASWTKKKKASVIFVLKPVFGAARFFA